MRARAERRTLQKCDTEDSFTDDVQDRPPMGRDDKLRFFTNEMSRLLMNMITFDPQSLLKAAKERSPSFCPAFTTTSSPKKAKVRTIDLKPRLDK